MFDRDKREWKRVAVNLPAKCRLVDGPAHYDELYLVDMHHQGCCMKGHVPFQKGDLVRIVIEVPFEGPMSLTGEVAWCGAVDANEDIRTGVRFIIDSPLAEEMSMKLYHYCLLRQPKG